MISKERWGGYNIGMAYARQLVAVTKLLNEAIQSDESAQIPASTQGSLPAMKEDLTYAVEEIKASLTTHPSQLFGPQLGSSYANAIREGVGAFHPLTTKPASSAEAQEKENFVSPKNTDKNSPFMSVLV